MTAGHGAEVFARQRDSVFSTLQSLVSPPTVIRRPSFFSFFFRFLHDLSVVVVG